MRRRDASHVAETNGEAIDAATLMTDGEANVAALWLIVATAVAVLSIALVVVAAMWCVGKEDASVPVLPVSGRAWRPLPAVNGAVTPWPAPTGPIFALAQKGWTRCSTRERAMLLRAAVTLYVFCGTDLRAKRGQKRLANAYGSIPIRTLNRYVAAPNPIANLATFGTRKRAAQAVPAPAAGAAAPSNVIRPPKKRRVSASAEGLLAPAEMTTLAAVGIPRASPRVKPFSLSQFQETMRRSAAAQRAAQNEELHTVKMQVRELSEHAREIQQRCAESAQLEAALWRGETSNLTRLGRERADAIREKAYGEHALAIDGAERDLRLADGQHKSAMKKLEKQNCKLQRELATSQANAQEHRQSKNAAKKEARASQQKLLLKIKEIEWEIERKKVLEEAIRSLRDDHVMAKEELEELKEELDRRGVCLLDELGVPGSAEYSLKVLEMGLVMMASGLTAEDARVAILGVMNLIHPNLVEGRDFRVVSISTFQKLRRSLPIVLDVLTVATLQKAAAEGRMVHVMHDASDKYRRSLFGVTFRVEQDGGEAPTLLAAPFAFPPSATSEDEGKAVLNAFSHQAYGGAITEQTASLGMVASVSSDTASTAMAVSRIVVAAQAAESAEKARVREAEAEKRRIGYQRLALRAGDFSASAYTDKTVDGIAAAIAGVVTQAVPSMEDPADGGAVGEDGNGPFAIADLLAALVERVGRSTALDLVALVLKCSNHITNLLSNAIIAGEEEFLLELARLYYAEHVIARWYRVLRYPKRLRSRQYFIVSEVLDKATYMDPTKCDERRQVVDQFINAMSKLAGPAPDQGGLHSLHKLSELSEIETYTEQCNAENGTNVKLERLQVELGSRQLYNTEQASSIVKNTAAYLAYLEKRVPTSSGDANKLVTACFAGLSNIFVMTALIARAVAFETLLNPVRQVINAQATRQDLYTVWNALIEALDDLQNLQAFETFRARLLAALPNYQTSFDEWARVTAAGRKTVTDLVTEEYKGLVALYLRRVGARVEAKVRKHMGEDLADVEQARQAPCTTDDQERGFAVYQQVLTKQRSTGPLVAGAVATSMATHAFEGPLQRAVRMERSRKGKVKGQKRRTTQELLALAQIGGRDSTALYFTQPEDMRHQLLRFAMSRAGQKVVAERQRAQIAAQEANALRRKMAVDEKKSASALARAKNYAKWAHQTLPQSKEALDALILASADAKLSVLINVIRIAKHVYQLKPCDLPKMSQKGSKRSADELYPEVVVLVLRLAQSPRPPPPQVLAVRTFAALHCSEARAALDRARRDKAALATTAWERLCLEELAPGDGEDALPLPFPVPAVAVVEEDEMDAGSDGEMRRGEALADALTAAAEPIGYKVLAPFIDDDDIMRCIVYNTAVYSTSDEVAMVADPGSFPGGCVSVCAFDDIEVWAETVKARRAQRYIDNVMMDE